MQFTSTYSRPFSYVDSACAFVYFNLVPSELGKLQKEIEAALELREADRVQGIQNLQSILLKLLFTQFHGTFLHEWHHCLQTIVYPYRYLQSWRELTIALSVLRDIRNSSDPFRLRAIDIPPAWRDTILDPSMVHGINIVNGMIVPVERDPRDLRPTDITLTDLIEEATCIFQYKTEQGEEGSGASYRQWIRSTRSAYSNVFRLLSKLMGVESAYVALPPLVQACFSTTWPGTVFHNLVNNTLNISNDLSPEKLGCDDYYSILCTMLEERHSSVQGSPPDPTSPSESDEFCYLDHSAYKRIVRSTPGHVVHPLANRYLEFFAMKPPLEILLFHPYHRDVMQLLKQEFLPPLIVLRLHNEALRARDSILIVSQKLRDTPVPVAPEATYSEYLPEIMKRKDIAYSLFTNLNNYLEHNCHHQDCPYYSTNVCRRWSAIPKEWSKCPFPQWFATVTGRSINLQSGELKKIS